ncbi:GDP-mannose-dependent alpha-(1-6)-phosphatidylinositol monomannoside mannosyltransferase [soil metagenome]
MITKAVNSGYKILIISNEFPPGPGGIGNHAYNLAKYLQEYDTLQISVLADTNYSSKQEIKNFDKTTKFNIYRIYRYKPIIFTYLKRILLAGRLIRKSDKIICSSKFSLWLGGIYQLIFRKKQFIAVVHGSELDLKNKWAKLITRFAINNFQKVISVSEYTQSYLPPKPASQKRKIIPNGIDISEKKDSPKMKDSKTLNNGLSLLTVGNITSRKGQKNMIRALPEIKKHFPNVHYHMAGLPTLKEELSQFAKEIKVKEHLTFHGKVTRDELNQIYENCDIFIMLSDHTANGDFEGFGIAVLEANLREKPAIGSRKSGIADAIDDGKTGILVDQHNDQEIAMALKRITEEYNEFSSQAYSWALDHDWEKIIKQYFSFINQK